MHGFLVKWGTGGYGLRPFIVVALGIGRISAEPSLHRTYGVGVVLLY